jgi:hypothetical protein
LLYPVELQALEVILILPKNLQKLKPFDSFGLGHSIQDKNRPWKKRYAKPFSPKDKDEAPNIVREIFISSGLPPVEYILNILNKEGGSP